MSQKLPEKKNAIQQLPWSVPVPLKESHFIPLHKKDSIFNVETDLSKISAFSIADRPKFPMCYSDLQTNADTNFCRRLGSGRAGFYKGHYLKGIGRTPLVGNWTDSKDLYHNSGLLFPSGAIREYLISSLISSTHNEHIINPCNGLLLGELPKSLKGHSKAALGLNLEARINDKLQAISVKKGGFARFSNFAWWLNQFPQSLKFGEVSGVIEFFALFLKYMDASNSDKVDYKIDADLIVDQLSKTIETSIDKFLLTWSLGIRFGSYQNNFTIDGRFLDLETPLVLPRPLIGLIAVKNQVTDKQKIVISPKQNLFGFEIFYYLKQVRIFIKFLKLKLNFIQEINNVESTMEKKFIYEFIDQLDQKIGRKHILYDFERLEAKLVPFLAKTLKVGRAEEKLIKELFQYHVLNFDREHWEEPKASKPMVFHRLRGAPLANSEPHFESICFVPEFLIDSNVKDLESNLNWNEQMINLDQMNKMNEVFDFLLKIKS